MSDQARNTVLATIIFNVMQQRGLLDEILVEAKRLTDDCYAIAEEVANFYDKGDSHDLDLLLPIGAVLPLLQQELAPLDLSEILEKNEQHPPRVKASMPVVASVMKWLQSNLLEGDERIANSAAERGDFSKLEELILNRGYLRTAVARKHVINRMRGDNKKRGETKSTVNVDTLKEVIKLCELNKCSWAEGERLWLTSNEKVDVDTLQKRISRGTKEFPELAKFARTAAKARTKARSQNGDKMG